MIPYGRQDVNDEDMRAVVEVLRSDFLTQGPAVPAFEEALAAYCGAGYGVAVNSATSALHLACLALDVGPRDHVWTSPITFVASANCARYCGAFVDFVDIDARTYNLSVVRLEEKLEEAARVGRLPKVVIPVHLAGQPCDMARIAELAAEYGFRVIEDASHAIGGRYRDDPIGNARHSDITVFSFHPVKVITTAEGGAAMTKDENLADRLRLLRNHGITRDRTRMSRDDGPWYYEQTDLGFNYRMTDLQAALGSSQLRRLDTLVTRRHELAARYDERLSNLPLSVPWQDPQGYSGLHLYIIRLKLNEIAISHRSVFEGLRAAGVGVNLHYIPVHLQPYYRRLGFRPGQYPEAEQYYREAISLPMFPSMHDAEQEHVVDRLRELLTVSPATEGR
jgi:UDP-4-amino-4,6-dideoxy-N-acetyl-beta-L-altrosamine transaminase